MPQQLLSIADATAVECPYCGCHSNLLPCLPCILRHFGSLDTEALPNLDNYRTVIGISIDTYTCLCFGISTGVGNDIGIAISIRIDIGIEIGICTGIGFGEKVYRYRHLLRYHYRHRYRCRYR